MIVWSHADLIVLFIQDSMQYDLAKASGLQNHFLGLIKWASSLNCTSFSVCVFECH